LAGIEPYGLSLDGTRTGVTVVLVEQDRRAARANCRGGGTRWPKAMTDTGVGTSEVTEAVQGGTVLEPARAAEVAAANGSSIGRLLTSEMKGTKAAGKCSWHLVTLKDLPDDERWAIAWIIADALMRTRCGKSSAYAQWRAAALSGSKIADRDRTKLLAFIQPVLGTPDAPGLEDHLEGYVAEWLWYLLMWERADDDRQIALLEPPKWTVTEPGPDGFVIYQLDDAPMVFRLWEIKKYTGEGAVSATVREAYGQLRRHGGRYLAQLTAIHADKVGALGQLCAQLVDLWVDADDRAGAGVGVTSAAVPAPVECFTTMGTQFPQFTKAGQLEGMLCAVERYRDLACDVRRLVWSVL
jgi:hypothetical protein